MPSYLRLFDSDDVLDLYHSENPDPLRSEYTSKVIPMVKADSGKSS